MTFQELITRATIIARSGEEPSAAFLQSVKDIALSWYPVALRNALVAANAKSRTPAERAALLSTQSVTLVNGSATLSPALLEATLLSATVTNSEGIALSLEAQYPDYLDPYKDNRIGYWHVRGNTFMASLAGDGAGVSDGTVTLEGIFVPDAPSGAGDILAISAAVEAELIPLLGGLIRNDPVFQQLAGATVREATA